MSDVRNNNQEKQGMAGLLKGLAENGSPEIKQMLLEMSLSAAVDSYKTMNEEKRAELRESLNKAYLMITDDIKNLTVNQDMFKDALNKINFVDAQGEMTEKGEFRA